MAKKNKFYVVWEGNTPGIYDNWKTCELQIKGYPNAKYKGFPSLQLAKQAYNEGVSSHIKSKVGGRKNIDSHQRSVEVVLPSWSVDAACSGNPGLMEYQGVLTKDKTPIFHMGPFQHGTNNVGEFLALVHALALLKKEKLEQVPIYSDSKIAMGWVFKKKCNTKLKRIDKNQKLFILIERAETWLKSNTFENPILKWKTKEWGEIPADFGRK